VAGQLT